MCTLSTYSLSARWITHDRSVKVLYVYAWASDNEPKMSIRMLYVHLSAILIQHIQRWTCWLSNTNFDNSSALFYIFSFRWRWRWHWQSDWPVSKRKLRGKKRSMNACNEAIFIVFLWIKEEKKLSHASFTSQKMTLFFYTLPTNSIILKSIVYLMGLN